MRKAYGFERVPTTLILVLPLMTLAPRPARSQQNDWSLFLSLRETRQSDRGQTGRAFDDRITDGASAGLSFSTRTERSSVGFNARTGVNFQREPDTESRDRLNYGGGFAWNYRTSPRSSMRLSQNVSKNIRLETLSELGRIGADFDTLTATTRWSFQHQSGPRTSWGTTLGYGYREFGNRAPVEASEIVLNEDPFGDEVAIPTEAFTPTDFDEMELPDGEEDILRIVATEGLNTTDAVSHRASASFGLNHSFTQRTSFNVGVAGGYRSIDASRAREGSYGSVQAVLQRSTSVSSAVSTGYTFSRTLVIDPSVGLHTVFAGWSYSPTTSTLSIRLFAGASRYEAEGLPSTTAPVATASLAGALSRSTTAGIAYRRQFSVSRGFGRSLLIDYFSANLSQQIGSRVSAQINAGLTLGSDPLDDSLERDHWRAGGSLTARLVGGLRAGTSYHYTETEQTGEDAVSERQRSTWSFYLSYSTDF